MRFAAVVAYPCAALAMVASPVMAQESGDVVSASPVEAIAGDLAARNAAILQKHGTWSFIAPRGAPKGSPVCTENWTFRADGTMTVVSGSQTVEKTWRVVSDQGFKRLFTTSLSSTDGMDCMGERANPADYPMEESGGFAMLFFPGDDSALLCNPMLMENPDGTTTPFYGDKECWGELRVVQPQAQIQAPETTQDPNAVDRQSLVHNR